MAEKDKDKTARWLIKRSGGPLLEALGGHGPIAKWQALVTDLAQPQRVSDGLLDVWRPGDKEPSPRLIEVVTYASNAAALQALGDLALSYSITKVVPSVWVLVLRPKGLVNVPRSLRLASDDRSSELGGKWRVIPLWRTPARVILERNNPYLMPWLPLLKTNEEPQAVLRRCVESVKRSAPAEDHVALLGATEVFARLRYGTETSMEILKPMGDFITDLPIWREIKAESHHKAIAKLLRRRFGDLPQGLIDRLKTYTDEDQLAEVTASAGTANDLAAFRASLPEPILFDEYGDPIEGTGSAPSD